MWKCHFPAEPVPHWPVESAMPVSHLTAFTVDVLKLYFTLSCSVSISAFDTRHNPKGKWNYSLAACTPREPFWENQSRRELGRIDCSWLCAEFTKHRLKTYSQFISRAWSSDLVKQNLAWFQEMLLTPSLPVHSPFKSLRLLDELFSHLSLSLQLQHLIGGEGLGRLNWEGLCQSVKVPVHPSPAGGGCWPARVPQPCL